MPHTSDALIAELVDDLAPVRPLRFGEGIALTLAAAGVTAVAVVAAFGLRAEWLAGHLDPMQLVSTGLFLGLALAASVTVVGMSRPQVGSDHSGWRWAAAMAGLLPLAGAIVAAVRGSGTLSPEVMRHGAECLAGGSAASLLVFAMLVLWLRRGAPTSPERAGLVAGVAAGAFGIFAASLHCPVNDIVHIGLWHSAAVVAMGLVGRVVVPRLIRW
ncbi:MAG: NrsF family protein [Erythrobacter sp.]